MQTQTQDITTSREQGQTHCTSLHIFNPGHGERQWIMQTDLRQPCTRVKPGEREGSSLLVKRDRSTTRESSLESFGVGSSISAPSGNGVGTRLVGGFEPLRTSDKTRSRREVKTPVCNTPKASSATAGRIERANRKVEEGSRTSRSWFEGVIGGTCLFFPGTALKLTLPKHRRPWHLRIGIPVLRHHLGPRKCWAISISDKTTDRNNHE